MLGGQERSTAAGSKISECKKQNLPGGVGDLSSASPRLEGDLTIANFFGETDRRVGRNSCQAIDYTGDRIIFMFCDSRPRPAPRTHESTRSRTEAWIC